MFVRLIVVAATLFSATASLAETQEERKLRLDREIQQMQRDIRERNREIEQQTIQRQREAEMEQRRRDEMQRRDNLLSNDGQRVIVIDSNRGGYPPPPSTMYPGGTVIIGPPQQQQRPVWTEPLIPGVDRGQILMRGQYWVQPDYSCQIQSWMDDRGQTFQRWVCP